MPQATHERTTPTRRTALRGTANALLAGLLAPRLASAAPTDNPDAALIALCDQLVRVRNAEDALWMSCHTREEERRAEPQQDALHAEYEHLLREVEALPEPTTIAGAAAVARFASALAIHDADGQVRCVDTYDWLVWTVVSCLAEGRIEA